jgi:pimeloyl-ACP methyl ester carboxylesterase
MPTIATKDGTQIYHKDWGTVPRATLKVIPGAPHGMHSTLKDRINAELLAFLERRRTVAA